jgi:hypothetical protein
MAARKPIAERKVAGVPKPEDVVLRSECGIDYTPLKQFLEKREFQNADDETRALLIKVAGPGAVERGWVYFSDVSSIPEADLETMDRLWLAYSGGKFGYSVQRKIFLSTKCKKDWVKWYLEVNWIRSGDNVGSFLSWPKDFEYNTTAPKGHLPLTNHLRGPLLHEAIFNHPAFNKTKSA